MFKDGVLVKADKFTTTATDVAGKLSEIRQIVDKLLEDTKPNLIAIEEIQLQNIPGSSQHGNVETFKKLAYVQGILIQLANEKGIEYTIVPSSSWKSTLHIKGKNRAEQKRNAQSYIEKTYNLKVTQDVCDSICIGEHVIKTTKEKEANEINWE